MQSRRKFLQSGLLATAAAAGTPSALMANDETTVSAKNSNKTTQNGTITFLQTKLMCIVSFTLTMNFFGKIIN